GDGDLPADRSIGLRPENRRGRACGSALELQGDRSVSGRMSDSAKPVMLEVRDLVVNYGVITALHGVSLSIHQGDIVTLIGANGAGKTTTLRTISGLLRPKSGNVKYRGEPITGSPPHRIVKRGLAQVPEG